MANNAPIGLFQSFPTISQYDLIIIALQESVDVNVWISDLFGIEFALLEKVDIGSSQTRLMQLTVLVNRKLSNQQKINCVERNSTVLDLQNGVNKGALLVTFNVCGCSLAIICCHLPANETKKRCLRRDRAVVEILKTISNKHSKLDIAEQYHHIIWLGDFNYRLQYQDMEYLPTTALPHHGAIYNHSHNSSHVPSTTNPLDNNSAHTPSDESAGVSVDGENEDRDTLMDNVFPSSLTRDNFIIDILGHITKRRWPEISFFDELSGEQLVKRNLLHGFHVPIHMFPPTYKRNIIFEPLVFHINENGAIEAMDASNFYDLSKIPSYTDRIIYKTFFDRNFRLIDDKISICEHAYSSDHKPICATFELTVAQGEASIKVDEDIFSSSQDIAYIKVALSIHAIGLLPQSSNNSSDFSYNNCQVCIFTDPPALLLDGNYGKQGVLFTPTSPDDVIEVGLACVDILDLYHEPTSLVLNVQRQSTFGAFETVGLSVIPFCRLLSSSVTFMDAMTQADEAKSILAKSISDLNIASPLSEMPPFEVTFDQPVRRYSQYVFNICGCVQFNVLQYKASKIVYSTLQKVLEQNQTTQANTKTNKKSNRKTRRMSMIDSMSNNPERMLILSEHSGLNAIRVGESFSFHAHKKGHLRHTWKWRYFEVVDINLFYYEPLIKLKSNSIFGKRTFIGSITSILLGGGGADKGNTMNSVGVNELSHHFLEQVEQKKVAERSSESGAVSNNSQDGRSNSHESAMEPVAVNRKELGRFGLINATVHKTGETGLVIQRALHIDVIGHSQSELQLQFLNPMTRDAKYELINERIGMIRLQLKRTSGQDHSSAHSTNDYRSLLGELEDDTVITRRVSFYKASASLSSNPYSMRSTSPNIMMNAIQTNAVSSLNEVTAGDYDDDDDVDYDDYEEEDEYAHESLDLIKAVSPDVRLSILNENGTILEGENENELEDEIVKKGR